MSEPNSKLKPIAVAAGLPGETITFESLSRAAAWLFENEKGRKPKSREIAGYEGNINRTSKRNGTYKGIEWVRI